MVSAKWYKFKFRSELVDGDKLCGEQQSRLTTVSALHVTVTLPKILISVIL